MAKIPPTERPNPMVWQIPNSTCNKTQKR